MDTFTNRESRIEEESLYFDGIFKCTGCRFWTDRALYLSSSVMADNIGV